LTLFDEKYVILYTMLNEILLLYVLLIEKFFRYKDGSIIFVFLIKNYLDLIDGIWLKSEHQLPYSTYIHNEYFIIVPPKYQSFEEIPL
jgi:hypothetical protein